MAESDLKALLEEAITYKRPKDREHKSEMFNELLNKTEMEDQEQNFPFTSRSVQSKRASSRPTQGGSLQDLQEASLHDYCYSEFSFANDYYTNLSGGLGMPPSRRHHGIGSSGVSCGPGGGDRAIMNPRQKKYTSSVSSRQREGGSLPSNVNVEYPVFNEVGHHHTTGTITKIKKREGGSKSDYSAMLLTAPMTSAGAAELITTVAEVAGGTGFSSGMKNTESQLIDGCGGGIGGSHTVIDMGELESDETQHLLAHDALQQNLYDSVLDDFEGNSTDLYGSTSNTGSGSTTGGAGSGCSALKKIPRFPTASYTSHAKLEIGEPSSTVRPSSVHHVDKTVSLPMLESNKSVDITPIQLGSSYQAVKCIVPSDSSKSDQAKHVLMGISANNTKYITTQSFNQIISQKYLDENGNSVQQFGSSASSSAGGGGSGAGGNSGSGASGNNSSSLGGSGGTGTGSAGGKKSRKPKSDRNTVLVIPENIEGYRGKDTDIESLVCYIENKDKQKDGKGSGGGGAGNGTGGGSGGSNPKNGTLLKVGASGNSAGNGNSATGVENGLPEERASKKKGEKKKEKAKLKKSNSLEELSSCSRKKQQAEDEQHTQRQPNHSAEQQSVSRVPAQEATEPSVVTLRNNKANKKGQNGNSTGSSSASSTTSSQSSKDTSASTAAGGGKRGERRSWGTEELSFLEDRNQLGANANEKSEEKVSSKKESKKEAKDSAEAAIPTFNLTKKRDSLRMSVESLSAVSVSGTAETAEFHVVTKKKKMKKKSQSLFAEETNTGTSASSNASNKRHSTVGQSYSMSSAGSSGRNANITGRYQPSHNFTNDRDVYMSSLASSGNDVSRRKSTSSMPPSEKSDSSDAESVQSLPIEPTRKQQQKNSAASHQPNRNQSGMVPQSYADIARIPNADKLNNNLLASGTSNNTPSALDSTSADRWPPVQATTSEDLAQALKSPSAFPELVPDSSSSSLPQSQHPNQQQCQQQQQQQYVNNSVNSVSSNNVGNNNKATYSQSLLIAAASTKATSATEEEDVVRQRAASGKLAAASSVINEPTVNSSFAASTNSNNTSSSSNSSTSSNSSSSNSKLALHKSKSVDNTDIYYSNEHYPALEKTVKSSKTGPFPVASANSTNSPDAKISSVSKTGPVVATSATGQFQNSPAYPPSMPAVNSSTNPSSLTGAKKSKKKDPSFHAASASITATEVETINNARNVASFQPPLLDTINNNPVLIENVEENAIDYSQNNGLMNRNTNGPANPQQQSHSSQNAPKTYASNNNSNFNSISSTTSNVVVSSKKNKKEKSTSQSNTQPQQIHGPLSHQSVLAHTNAVANSGSNHRPAVIIMNDNNDSSGSTKHEFTFGFDIDQDLLFGDFQEDDLNMVDQPPLHPQQQQYHHQYHNQQNPSLHHSQQQQQQPQQQSTYHNSNDHNVPSPTSNTSGHSADFGYGSLHQSLSISSPSSSSSSSQHSQQQQQQPPPPHHQQHHYHNQPQHQQQSDSSFEALNNSTDPDTYRDSIEHKFHQPPPPMVLPPAPLYSQPPPQLPPPHVLAAHQQQQQQQQHQHHHHQSRQQARPVNTTNHYNLPPPVIPGPHHSIQQQPPLPLKQDSATNTSPAMVISPNTAPAIMTVPPPPLPPVASAGVAAPLPLVVGQPPATVVLLPPVVISVNTNNTGYVSSRSNSTTNSPAAAVVSCNSSSSNASNNATNNTASLINQSTTSSGSNSSISSIASQQEPKPQRQSVSTATCGGSAVSIIREKVKEINLRFIAPEQLPTNHNHDKIVNFVGMAWEDIICGTNGSAKYYDGQ
ncbi:mucin-19 isoform X2 [Sabethes cyaneus]|nr:mucin-19 isoform X2 [Sabethes cyaneus]